MDIEKYLDSERMESYQITGSGDISPLDIYKIENKLGASCFEIISYFEVMIRNIFDEALKEIARESETGIPWYQQPGLGFSKETFKKTQFDKNGSFDLDGLVTRKDILSDQTLGYWDTIINSMQEDLWEEIKSKEDKLKEFPLSEFKDKFHKVYLLRNAIAHHNYLSDVDVAQGILSAERIMSAINKEFSEWVFRGNEWQKICEERDKMISTLDTIIVPASTAWNVYKNLGIYVTPVGRYHRTDEKDSKVKNIGFYADKEIKKTIPQILHIFDEVQWDIETAEDYSKRPDEFYNDLGKIMNLALSKPGLSLVQEWGYGKYKVFLLSSSGQEGQEFKKLARARKVRGENIELNDNLKNDREGRGSAYVQGVIYQSQNNLKRAKSIADLRNQR